MNTDEILLKAADVIEERGWHQGDFYDFDARQIGCVPLDECAVCAGGAVNIAADHVPDFYDLEDSTPLGEALEAFACHVNPSFRDELEEFGRDPDHWRAPDVYQAIADWNDAEGRTAEQVITALREAARAAGGA